MTTIARKLIPAFAVALLPCALEAQQPAVQPQLRLNGIELTVGGRLHTQFNTTPIDTEAPSELFIRRARLELGVRVNDQISGAIQPDFGDDEVELKDAYLRVAFTPGVQLLAGKAYRPFGLLEQTSSKRMLPIERGLRIRGLGAADEYALTSGLGYSNRDIGLQLLGTPEGAPLNLSYGAGVTRGPLHGKVGNQDSYQFSGRVTISPLELVRIGAGWSNRDFAEGDGESPNLKRGNAVEVDLEYGEFAPGFHLLAEVSRGDIDPFTDARFWGAQTWLAYRTGELAGPASALEPILRISYADTEAAGGVVPGGTLITPGLNYYFGPLNRIMVNYDIWRGGDGSRNANSFKAMFSLGF